jgi:hypothetical protein
LKISKLVSIIKKMAVSCLICTLIILIPARAYTAAQSNKTQPAAKQTNKDAPDPQAVKSALNAYRWAVDHGQVNKASLLTIVDFTKPSYEKRLWVIDLKNGRVLMHMHVAQGRNTGAIFAKRFSNSSGSHESSPGLFTTQSIYNGEHGESLRVNGLEKGINDHALSRAVVIHAASYVTPGFIKENGYAGRSWGCFAVNPAKVDKFINMIKGGTVLFAYASPEAHDPLVNHQLSSADEALYDTIMGETSKSSHWFF